MTYLVEDMPGPASGDMLADRERMNTAMWHIQVFAGFFLKRTGSTDQSIQYLTRMHRALEQSFQVRHPAPRACTLPSGQSD